MSNISDVISTASLLLAVVTALMGFWYADVTKAIDGTDPTLANEKKTLRERIVPVFWAKAVPLSLGSLVIALVFLWRALNIALEALQSIGTDAKYDDLKAAFFVTEVLMVLLAVVTCRLAWKLGRRCWRLR